MRHLRLNQVAPQLVIRVKMKNLMSLIAIMNTVILRPRSKLLTKRKDCYVCVIRVIRNTSTR